MGDSGRVWGIVPRWGRGRDSPKPIKQGSVRRRGPGWSAETGMVLSYPAPTRPVAIPTSVLAGADRWNCSNGGTIL
ncbi:unnamed protein product [Prunus armeniaca]